MAAGRPALVLAPAAPEQAGPPACPGRRAAVCLTPVTASWAVICAACFFRGEEVPVSIPDSALSRDQPIFYEIYSVAVDPVQVGTVHGYEHGLSGLARIAKDFPYPLGMPGRQALHRFIYQYHW